MRVVVIGGVGGLTAPGRLAAFGHRAALRSARRGGWPGVRRRRRWTRSTAACILLDRPGLEWAFERLGIDVAALDLEPMHQLCE